MSTTINTTIPGVAEAASPGRAPSPSPLRVIRSLLARMRGARMLYGDCGGLLEVDILDDQTAALKSRLDGNAAEAGAIDAGAADLTATIRAIAADGVVDATEKRLLARLCPTFTRLVHSHRSHAAELAG